MYANSLRKIRATTFKPIFLNEEKYVCLILPNNIPNTSKQSSYIKLYFMLIMKKIVLVDISVNKIPVSLSLHLLLYNQEQKQKQNKRNIVKIYFHIFIFIKIQLIIYQIKHNWMNFMMVNTVS